MVQKLEKCSKKLQAIEKKNCCVTVDNASANNVVISYLSRGLSVWNGHTLLNGELMHMQCVPHIF